MRILLAEDDPLLGEAIASHLAQVAHAVDWVRDGAAADAALRAQTFDLVVLDLGLPRMSGKDVLKHMRDRALATPVLIITAADAIADRVAGLDAGADDYLVKPFALAELEARIRALIRRSNGHDRNLLVNGPLAGRSPGAFSTARSHSTPRRARPRWMVRWSTCRRGSWRCSSCCSCAAAA